MGTGQDSARHPSGHEHTIVVPASVANLGGGFDTLGVAVQLYLRARIVTCAMTRAAS